VLIRAWERRDVSAVVDAYVGEFLPEFAAPGGAEFERWADSERRHLRGIFSRAGETLVREWLSQGKQREARELAARVRNLDVLNQSGWRLLLETLIAGRDAVGAAVEVEQMERLFAAEELELEPATIALVKLARKERVSSGHDSTGQISPMFSRELVGREREFSLILKAWDQARDGRFTHLHLSAPAGLGKSRLLTDVYARLKSSLARVLLVRANYGAREIGYAFASDVAAALATRAGARGISPQSASALVALNPILSTHWSAAPDSSVGDEAMRRRSLALREMLVVLTEDQPVALLLDDLHWSDRESRRLLGVALGGLSRTRVLVLSAAREFGTEEAIGANAQVVALPPLTPSAVYALLTGIAPLPVAPWSDRLPHSMHDAAHGSPLLVLETVQLLVDRGLLRASASGWEALDPTTLEIELGEGSALRRRIGSLPATEREALTNLATAGIPLSEPVLCRTSDMPVHELQRDLQSLEQRGLAVRRGELWSTAHDEYAQAILSLLAVGDKSRVAVTVGRAILREGERDRRALQVAAPLLARGNDRNGLIAAAQSYVDLSREQGDRRSPRAMLHELLAGAATPEQEGRIYHDLPLSMRLARGDGGRSIVLAAASLSLLMLLVIFALFRRSGTNPVPDTIVAALRLSSDGTRYDVFAIPIDLRERRDGRSLDLAIHERANWSLTTSGVSGRALRPDGAGWTGGRALSREGDIELFDNDLHGGSRRLTFARGDDAMASWAPDNSALVFSTGRASARARYDLAIYDTLTRQVRLLTVSDNSDSSPSWSPDGSRIVFSRKTDVAGASLLCLIDADGTHLQCASSAHGRVANIVGWSDAHHVLYIASADSTSRLLRRDVYSASESLIVENAPAGATFASPDGRWILCTCTRRELPAGTTILFPTTNAADFTVLRVAGVRSDSLHFEFAPTVTRPAYVNRLAFEQGLGSPILGASYQVRASATDVDGRSIAPGVLRWSVSDTAVATVDSTGLLRPKRVGTVRLALSAGGWRAVEEDLSIRPNIVRDLLDEDWSHDITARWTRFGEPQPTVQEGAPFGQGLSNNGDGFYYSGVSSAEGWPTADGLWLSTSISARITLPEWQEQIVSLFALLDSSARGTSRADEPRGKGGCILRYPQLDGGTARSDSITLQAVGEPRSTPAPPYAASGRVMQVTIQVFPDGRCGFAVDGVAVHETVPMFTDFVAHAKLFGSSAGTRILVGNVRVATGISSMKW
jgi:hypothetical protein